MKILSLFFVAIFALSACSNDGDKIQERPVVDSVLTKKIEGYLNGSSWCESTKIIKGTSCLVDLKHSFKKLSSLSYLVTVSSLHGCSNTSAEAISEELRKPAQYTLDVSVKADVPSTITQISTNEAHPVRVEVGEDSLIYIPQETPNKGGTELTSCDEAGKFQFGWSLYHIRDYQIRVNGYVSGKWTPNSDPLTDEQIASCPLMTGAEAFKEMSATYDIDKVELDPLSQLPVKVPLKAGFLANDRKFYVCETITDTEDKTMKDWTKYYISEDRVNVFSLTLTK